MKHANKKILIVDDDRNVRRSICRMLGFLGFIAAEASSGEDAIGILDQEQFDLVLMDVMMPGMGGIEAAKKIAYAHENQPLILMSGYYAAQEDAAALPRGVRKILAKPIDMDTLVAIIQQEIEAAV